MRGMFVVQVPNASRRRSSTLPVRRIAMFVLLGWSVVNLQTTAQEQPGRVILEELDQPFGLARQPGSGHLFISESGAGRVIRYFDEQQEEVVTGFPREPYDRLPDLQLGPLGLTFVNNEQLVIGTGGESLGEERILIVRVPEPGSPPTNVDAAMTFGPLRGRDLTAAGNNFFGIVATTKTIYGTAHDESGGWVASMDILKADELEKSSSYGRLRRFATTDADEAIFSPTGVAVSPNGELLISQIGEIRTQTSDSRIAFYRVTDAKRLLSLSTGLRDITGICYGAPQPPTNKPLLYVIDSSWAEPEYAGLFRLDAELKDGVQSVKSVKISSLNRPTAIELGLDGSLYVTELGPADRETPAGRLIQFPPGL